MRIIQIVRHAGPGKGVGGVAAALTSEFRRLGVEVDELTLETLKLERLCRQLERVSPRLAAFAEVVLFTLISPVFYLIRYAGADSISISHNDCLIGDIYVNHGLQRALIFPKGRPPRLKLLVDPLNLFIFLREQLRYLIRSHQVIVNFSQSGESEHRDYCDLSSFRLAIVPNGVDLDRFSANSALGTLIRSQYGIPEQCFLSLFVGNEFERKGLPLLLRAIDECSDDFHLLVAGGTAAMIAKAQKEISSLTQRRVHFAGFQSKELPNIYAAADVLVLPSSQEAWPLVLLEAMASGVPCVSTSVSSTSEILCNGDCGMIIGATIPEIFEALNRLQKDPDLGRRLATNAAQKVDSYSWPLIALRYLDLVRSTHEMKRASSIQ